MEKFKITSHLECLGPDPEEPGYLLYTFDVKAEIDGKIYMAETEQFSHIEWVDIIIDDCPCYAYIGDCGSEYEIFTCWTANENEDRWIKDTLKMFYKGEPFSENAYIIEIATNKIIAEYHDTRTNRSIIIHDKEKCYLA